ncbi:hypothetical protein NN561_010816 [Cricetulus griseus]
MATCHDDLGNLHTEPAGLQTGDMGERNPTAQAGSSPLQSLLGHTQPQTLSPSPTSETAHLSSPRARPDLAPDSWRSGTRTTGPAAREAQRGFLASARDARVRQRKAPGTRRAGAPGLPERDVPATHRGDAATQAKAARGPAADPRAHRGAAWAGCRCSPQERGAHLCFMLLCPQADSRWVLRSRARACLPVCGWHLWPVYRAVQASAGALYWTESSEEGMKNLGLPPSVGPHRCISAKAAEVSAVAELARAPRGCHGNQEQAPALVAEEGCGEKVTDKR